MMPMRTPTMMTPADNRQWTVDEIVLAFMPNEPTKTAVVYGLLFLSIKTPFFIFVLILFHSPEMDRSHVHKHSDTISAVHAICVESL